MFRRWCGLCWCVAVLLSVATSSVAEDLNPPGYRGLPNSTSAEWGFTAPGPAFFPGGGSVSTVVGNTGPPAPGVGTPFPFCVLGGTASFVPGGIAGGSAGGTIACNIPNWHDNEPVKRQRVQVTYKGPKPSIRKFCFLGVPGSSAAVTETLIAEVLDTTLALLASGSSYFYQDWECRPNPDWEQVVVDVPPGTVIDQLVVDTISSTRRCPSIKITVTPSGSPIPTLITNPDQPYQIKIELQDLDVGQIVGGSVKYNGADVTGLVLQHSNIVMTPTGAQITLPVLSLPRGLKGTFRVELLILLSGILVAVHDDVIIDNPM